MQLIPRYEKDETDKTVYTIHATRVLSPPQVYFLLSMADLIASEKLAYSSA
jgi:hypothetical protein